MCMMQYRWQSNNDALVEGGIGIKKIGNSSWMKGTKIDVTTHVDINFNLLENTTLI